MNIYKNCIQLYLMGVYCRKFEVHAPRPPPPPPGENASYATATCPFGWEANCNSVNPNCENLFEWHFPFDVIDEPFWNVPYSCHNWMIPRVIETQKNLAYQQKEQGAKAPPSESLSTLSSSCSQQNTKMSIPQKRQNSARPFDNKNRECGENTHCHYFFFEHGLGL